MAHTSTKSLQAAGRPLPSGMRFSNLWSLISAVFYDANVKMPRRNDETQFACEGCGDLVTLERARLRSAYSVGGVGSTPIASASRAVGARRQATVWSWITRFGQ